MAAKLIKCSKDDVAKVKEIAKKHGLKGCKQPLNAVMVGKQATGFIDIEVCKKFFSDLRANGFFAEEERRMENLNYTLFDVFMVWKIA